ncbi:Uncharacterised protein [Yersinia frederiksenii]|nr:Uncharacterised protein [Yersinia frederiksenii]
MAALTIKDIKALLSELGYTMPETTLKLLMGQVDKIDSCLIGAGYDEGIQQIIKLYAVVLLAASTGARRLKSQGAPNGASRSFEYGENGLRQLRASLKQMDTNGCTDSLPISISPVGIFMAVG